MVKRISRSKGVKKLTLQGIGPKGRRRSYVLAHGSRWRGLQETSTTTTTTTTSTTTTSTTTSSTMSTTTTTAMPPAILTIEKLADANDSVSIHIGLPAATTVYVDWGDESGILQVDGPQGDYNCYHDYGNEDAWTIEMSGDLDKIVRFTVTTYPISFDIGDLAQMTNLEQLVLQILPAVTGELADLSGLTALTTLDIYNGIGVTGDIADLATLTNLIELRLTDAGAIDTYTQGTLPDWDPCDFFLSGLGLSQQEVDDFLCDLNAASSASVQLVQIAGSNAVPSAAGLVCKGNLEGKGWTVTVST